MNITLKEITPDNFEDIISLKAQKYCASNLYSLAQAKVDSSLMPLAIYNEDTPVGFIMYGKDPDDNNEYWIVRLMIDFQYQKNGFGKKAMEMIIDEIKQDKSHDKIKLSTDPENTIGIKLYNQLGFTEIGEIIHGETVMVLKY
jgi:diamine N-acetyltransferase